MYPNSHNNLPRRVHPRQSANIISKIFFYYMLGLFRKGVTKDLEERDLYKVPREYRSKSLGKRLEQTWKEGNSSIFRVLFKCFGLYYFWLGIVHIILDSVLMWIQPYLIGQFVSYFAPKSSLGKDDAWMYACCIVTVDVLHCILRQHYYFALKTLGLKMRASLCSLIYRKAIRLDQAHLGANYVGNLMNLITKDVANIEQFTEWGNETWTTFVNLLVFTVILYVRIGNAALVGMGIVLISVSVQMCFGLKLAQYRRQNYKKTDARLQATQETFSAIRIIKMYVWEKFFEAKINKTRRNELLVIYKITILKVLTYTFGIINCKLAFVLLFLSYKWFGGNITSASIYVIFMSFRMVATHSHVMLQFGVVYTVELAISAQRIQQLLKMPNCHCRHVQHGDLPQIHLQDVSLTVKSTKILQSINLSINAGLTIVTGGIGCGKTSLLKMILGEYEPQTGHVVTQGDISYASQEPWLFPATIRQNIVFNGKYDAQRYQQVLNVCALTCDVERLDLGDQTMVEDCGSNLSKGQQTRVNLARALYKRSDIYLLDDCLTGIDQRVSLFIFARMRSFLRDKVVLLVDNSTKWLKYADNVLVLMSGDAQLSVVTAAEDPGTNITEDIPSSERSALRLLSTAAYEETKPSGKVPFAVYKKYVMYGGGLGLCLVALVSQSLTDVCVAYSEKVLSNWIAVEERNPSGHAQSNHVTYQLVTVLGIAAALSILSSVAFFNFIKTASLKLHDKMLSSLLAAKMYFFDSHLLGNILNRFSKDFASVDELLPLSLLYSLKLIVGAVSRIAMVVSVNNMYVFPVAALFVVLLWLRRICLRLTRSLKRLETMTRSPLVGHINATLEGLTTITAFTATNRLIDEFDQRQDVNTSTSYTLVCSMTAYTFIFNCLCSIFMAAVLVTYLIWDDDPASSVGFAITQSFVLLVELQLRAREWSEVEHLTTSVERVLEYCDVEAENRQGVVTNPQGSITYDGVNLTYPKCRIPTLRNISFEVGAGHKVAIIGRTGAGKSSIISTLFRLYEAEGTITIDGVDIKTLSLDSLRSKISLIPQNSFVFSGSLRDNIDPLQQFSDEQIWNVLKTVNLQRFVPSLSLIDLQFTRGQKQLLCIARAILRDSQIVVLDEPLSCLDPETDVFIHNAIQENFGSRTVLVVTHKLHTILNCDKILVLDEGEIVKDCTPEVLFKDADGTFL